MELGNLQKSAQWGEFLLLAVQNAGIVNVVNLAESRNTCVRSPATSVGDHLDCVNQGGKNCPLWVVPFPGWYLGL